MGSGLGTYSCKNLLCMSTEDRLVWLDSDGLLTRSMDYLFELPGTWSQGEDGDCTGEPKTVNSGLLLFQPSKAIEKGTGLSSLLSSRRDLSRAWRGHSTCNKIWARTPYEREEEQALRFNRNSISNSLGPNSTFFIFWLLQSVPIFSPTDL